MILIAVQEIYNVLNDMIKVSHLRAFLIRILISLSLGLSNPYITIIKIYATYEDMVRCYRANCFGMHSQSRGLHHLMGRDSYMFLFGFVVPLRMSHYKQCTSSLTSDHRL